MYINAEAIKEYREEHGITIDEMAELLGIEGESLYNYESGEPWYEEDAFTLYIINSISEDLDFISIDIDELYEEYEI